MATCVRIDVWALIQESKMAPLRFESDGFGRKTICPFLFLFSSGSYLILTFFFFLKKPGCQQENKKKTKEWQCSGGSRSATICESYTVSKCFCCVFILFFYSAVSPRYVLYSKVEGCWKEQTAERFVDVDYSICSHLIKA